ncbi:potassium channel subfamily K member 4-like [Narcine bancroftii]|uniref:potassium channel subfamily K member 4-like n=1 Tax=Narcine bancroftii TaxID=1343680 RepID=UPI0038317728
MERLTVLALLLVVLTYLVLGAALFHLMEQPLERERWMLAAAARLAFLQDHSCVEAGDLDLLLQQMVSAAQEGIDPTGNSSHLPSNWDLSGAFFFAGTVITTIGFGNVAPRTDEGRLLCIVYALVGIPMFASLLMGVGDQLGLALGQLIGKVEKVFQRCGVRPSTIRVLSVLLFLLLGCFLFISSPTLVFQWVEGWSVLESVYFVIITLTTIGFGDYVAGSDSSRGYKVWYKPLVWFWIVLGLAYFASIFSMIGDWLRVLSRRTQAEVSGLTAQAVHWTSNIATDIKAARWDSLPPRDVPLGKENAQGLEERKEEQEEEERTTDEETLPSSPEIWKPIDFVAENIAYIDTEDSESCRSPLTRPRGKRKAGPHGSPVLGTGRQEEGAGRWQIPYSPSLRERE